jgi:hypothetical protein
MTGFQALPVSEQTWFKNVLGSEVTRFYTDGAVLTVVHGRKGDTVPSHGYSKGSATYVVSGKIEIDGVTLGAGDAGIYKADSGFFGVRFLEDSTYVVARVSDDEITLPDIGERAAHHLDA